MHTECVAKPADKCHEIDVEKKLKYKSCCIEIQRMWNIKCMIVPVIIGATGHSKKRIKENVSATAGEHSAVSPQKQLH
jgi:hypothetical protein